MKTERMQPLPEIRDEVLLAEEVLVVRPSRPPRRMLAACALAALPELLQRKQPFELRRLNQDLLANFDGETIHGRPDVVEPLTSINKYMEMIVRNLSVEIAKRVSAELQARQDSVKRSSADGREDVLTAGPENTSDESAERD